MALWGSLPTWLQDTGLLLVLLAPTVIVGTLMLRGFAPWGLVGAILWRFRWANTIFVLLISVSVGTGIGILAQERGLRQGSAQAADKFDVLITAPGSELTMMLAAVYLQPSDIPLLDGYVFNEVATHESVDIAAPLAFGDSWEGAPIVGTTADFVRHLTDDQVLGRMWTNASEAIVGAAVSLEIGDSFTPSHGHGDAADPQAHAGEEVLVVGRMARTGTPWDRALLVPVEQVWRVHGLADGHAPENAGQIGPPFDADYFPGTPAIIVRAEALWASYAIRSEFTRDAETMAFFPGTVLSNLYRVLGDVRRAMSLLSLVTQMLVAVSVLLGLFLLMRVFQRQVALLRVLGAPTRFVFSVMWSYSAVLLISGSALGLIFGMLAAAVLSRIVTAQTDVLIRAPIGWTELHVIAGFIAVTTVLSLLPAAIAVRRSALGSLRF
ncbi:MAG: ABC transporter permease [Pseudomonadota bacterium]